MSIRAESCQQLGSCRQDHARAVNRRIAPFVFFKMSMSSPTAINAGTIYDAGLRSRIVSEAQFRFHKICCSLTGVMKKSCEAEPYELYELQELFELREPYEPGELYELDGLNLLAVQNGGTSAAIATYRCPAV